MAGDGERRARSGKPSGLDEVIAALERELGGEEIVLVDGPIDAERMEGTYRWWLVRRGEHDWYRVLLRIDPTRDRYEITPIGALPSIERGPVDAGPSRAPRLPAPLWSYRFEGGRLAGYRNLRDHRAYDASGLPVFEPGVPREQRPETLRLLYGEVNAAWRQLTEVRFKLLGLIPAASVLLLVTLVERAGAAQTLDALVGSAVALFGLVITAALYTYHLRNDELYDDMISRGRRIELELGIESGLFRGRRTPGRRLPGGLVVRHGIATRWLYRVSMAAYLAAIALIWARTLIG